MPSPQFGPFPQSVIKAFAILNTTPSEPLPDGRLVVNQGGILSNYIRVGSGHYSFDLLETGVPSQDNTGCHATPLYDEAGGEAGNANFCSYLIEAVSPPKLHVYVFDASGTPRDATCVTITLYGSSAGAPA